MDPGEAMTVPMLGALAASSAASWPAGSEMVWSSESHRGPSGKMSGGVRSTLKVKIVGSPT